MLGNFQHQLLYDLGEGQSTPTIFMNTFQAKRLNWGLEHDTDTHESYLFVITANSEAVGPLLREHDFNCDFLVVKFETPLSQVYKLNKAAEVSEI